MGLPALPEPVDPGDPACGSFVAPVDLDLDGDGDRDLLVASATDNSIAWYENLDEDPMNPVPRYTKHVISTRANEAIGWAGLS